MFQYCGEEDLPYNPERPCVEPETPEEHDPEVSPPIPRYDDMPPLDKREFTSFYTEATKDVDKTIDPDAIYVTDIEGGQNLVMATAAFGKARELMTWLEFWVYMCADGIMPP